MIYCDWFDRQLYIFLAVYGACLGWLLPKLSLWLDEVRDLIGSRSSDLPALMSYVRNNPGAVPLGYLVERVSIQAFGMSAFSGRLPSALASVLGCMGIFILARRTGLRWPLLATATFAALPLQLRYALEARGYSLALCLSIWATVFFVSAMNRQPTRTLSAWYGVCLIGVLYVQPYGFFVAAAHWLSIVKWPLDCSSLFRRASVFMLLALISFAPWYLYASGTWAHSIHLVEGKYSFDFHSLLLIFRELVGMGYFGTAAILIGAFIGLRRRVDEGRTRFFWLCYLVIPIVGAATVDAAAGYFLAIRQMIFVLPPLSILFALGAESILERRRTVGASLAAAIFLGALYANWRFFHRPREDWQAASSTLMEERKHGACVFIAPADSAYLYTFFRPELTESQCDSTSLDGVQRVVVAVSSLDKEASLAAIENRLYASGFKKQNILRNREPQVSLFVRK